MKFLTIAIFMILLLLISGGAVCYTRLTGCVDADTLKTIMLQRIAREQRAANALEMCVTAALRSSRAGKIAFQNYYSNTINGQPDRWLNQLILIGQTAALFDADLPSFYPQTKICYLQADMISLDTHFAVYAINNSHPDFWQRTGSLLFYTPMLIFMLVKKFLLGLWAVIAAAIAVKLMTCHYKNTVKTVKTVKNNSGGEHHG